MSKIVNEINNDFTIIPNTILQDTRVSGLAFKIYCYIAFRLGRNKEWEFYNNEILSHFKEGKKAFANAKKQLLEYGYLVKLGQNHNDDGSFAGNDYAIYTIPQNAPYSQKGCAVEGATLKASTLKGDTNNNDINKKDIKKNDLIKEKTNKKEIPTISILENVEPTVKESLTVEPTCKETLQVESVEAEVIPNCIDISKWEEWKNYRKEINHKLTKSTTVKQLKKLEKWYLDGQDPNEIIDNSISNGWTGLFALKQQKSNQSTFNNQYAKPKPDHFSIDKKYAGTKNDDFFDGYINGK